MESNTAGNNTTNNNATKYLNQAKQIIRRRLKKISDIYALLKEKQRRQLIQQSFVQDAKFKQDSYKDSQKRKKYFEVQIRNILCGFILYYDQEKKYQDFDNFSGEFYNWLNEESYPTFPITKQDLEQLANKRIKYLTQKLEQAQKKEQQKKNKQILLEQQQRQQEQRQKNLQVEQERRQKIQSQKLKQRQIQEQKQKYEKQQRQKQEKRKKEQKQKQKQRERQRQRQKQKQMNQRIERDGKNFHKRAMEDAMIDEAEERNFLIKQNQKNQGNQQPRLQYNLNRTPPIPPINTNAQLGVNQIVQRVQNKSPSHNSAPRYDETTRPYYSKPEPTKQEQIKKILAKICQSCEHIERRHKNFQQIKSELQILKRIEDNEKSRR